MAHRYIWGSVLKLPVDAWYVYKVLYLWTINGYRYINRLWFGLPTDLWPGEMYVGLETADNVTSWLNGAPYPENQTVLPLLAPLTEEGKHCGKAHLVKSMARQVSGA